MLKKVIHSIERSFKSILYFILTFILFQNLSFGQLQIENAFPNLYFNNPLYLTNAGDNSNRIFVVEQNGKITVFQNSPSAVVSKTFLDLSDSVSSGGEKGLLGLAFHPDYETNGYFYVNYTVSNPLRTVIARFQVSGDPDSADVNSKTEIITFNQPYENHNGGWLGFGPNDGYLYIATGDGGSGGDPENHAQRINTLLGKILRIDVNGGTPYAIPSSNPFYDSTNTDVRKEIYAWGLRNPWRCSFDIETGWFWAADVGQSAWEEIDIIQIGKNYGWRCYEGNHPYNLSQCNYAEYIFPLWEYNHTEGYSITGGYVYRNQYVPELYGKYIYGDYITRKVWALEYDGINPPSNQFLLNVPGFISSFGQDEQNELYITCFDGNIYKFTPTLNCGDININSGWNLLSVPFLSDDMSASNIFSNAVSNVFGHTNNGYIVADTLVNGAGYWVKYNNSQILQNCGTIVNADVELNTGWNLIGPFNESVSVENIITIPPGIINSQFFGYQNGYITVDTLKSANGYWVKTSENGLLNFNVEIK